jgi:hypothetical protein
MNATGTQEEGNLQGIVLQVRILHDDDVSGRGREPGPQRRPFATIVLVHHEPIDQGALEAGEQVSGSVRRAVVDDDHLQVQRDLPDALEQGLHRVDFVIDGYDDGESDPVPREVVSGRPAIGETGLGHDGRADLRALGAWIHGHSSIPYRFNLR